MRHTLPKNDDQMQHFELNGRAYWRHVETGRIGVLVRGGDEGEDDNTGEGEGEGGTGNGDQPKTFTQAELDRTAGRARTEARKAAENALAEQLGVSVDEAKTIIANAKAIEDGKKSDADKALDAARTAQAAADAARAEAAAERLAAKVERKLTAAGVPESALTRAVRTLALDPDADDDAITAEIEALQADVPALFATSDDTGDGKTKTPPPPAPGGTGARPPAGGQAAKTALEKGAERARQRHPQPA